MCRLGRRFLPSSSHSSIVLQHSFTSPLSNFILMMATSKAILTPLKDIRVSSYQIPAFGRIPNTSIQKKPLMIYHSAFEKSASASTIEDHLSSVGVVSPQWRYTMFSQSHFHSTSHEVLCVAQGKAKLCFGGKRTRRRLNLLWRRVTSWLCQQVWLIACWRILEEASVWWEAIQEGRVGICAMEMRERRIKLNALGL